MISGIIFIVGVFCGIFLRDFLIERNKKDFKPTIKGWFESFPLNKDIEPTNFEEYGSNRQTPPPFLF